MMSVTAVPTVHEEVHQWACEERKPHEGTEHVRAMLRKQQGARDDQKSDQYEPGTRKQQARHLSLPSRLNGL
jgi:hypothetical protein